MFVKAMEGPQERFAEVRREAIVICLKGLKVALDNKAPKERPDPPPPMVITHIITPNKELYEKEEAKYKKQLAEWEKFRHLYELYNKRNTLTRNCLTMYSVKQCDTQELREYAQKILVGYKDVVNDLVGKVEKRISSRKRRLEK